MSLIDRDCFAGIGGRQQFGDVAVDGRRDRSDGRHHLLELDVAGDEIGLGVDLRKGAGAARCDDADEALGRDAVRLLGRFDRPFLRSQSMACSISPLVSVSAVLQSIMPAPVRSRSSLTIVAEIVVMVCLSVGAAHSLVDGPAA